MVSMVTAPQLPKRTLAGQPVVADTPKVSSGSKVGLAIAAVVVLVLIAVGGVAGFLIWNKSKTNTVSTTGPINNPGAVTTAAPREIGSYWLELEPPDADAKPARVAALVPIASGQSFKFHFVFSESGYVYIFGPGENNKLTAFLTTKPWPDSGVTSNQVTQGRDFSFPRGAGKNVTLDKNPGTDVFTVIFARTALQTPAFLNDPVTAEPLSAAQQAELKAFAAKYQQTMPVTELDESTPDAPSVRVKVPPDQTGNPIVFDIRIQHN
jgi:hypothetical protein